MFRTLTLCAVAATLFAAANANAHPAHRHGVAVKHVKTLAVAAPRHARVVKDTNLAHRGHVQTVAVVTPHAALRARLPRGAVLVGAGPGRLYLAGGRHYRRVPGGYVIVS